MIRDEKSQNLVNAILIKSSKKNIRKIWRCYGLAKKRSLFKLILSN